MSKTYSKPVKIRRPWKATGKISEISKKQLEKEEPRCGGIRNDSIFNSDDSLRDDYYFDVFDKLKLGKTPLRNQHLLSKQVRADYNRDSSIDSSPFSLSTMNLSSTIDVIDSRRRSTPIVNNDTRSKRMSKNVEMPQQPNNSLIVESSISTENDSNHTGVCLESSKTENTTTRATQSSKKFDPIQRVYFRSPNNNESDAGFLQAVANISSPPSLSLDEPDQSSDYQWKIRLIVQYNCEKRNRADLEGSDAINYDGFLQPLRNSNDSNVGNRAEAVIQDQFAPSDLLAKSKTSNRVQIVPKKLSFSPAVVNISNKTDATMQTLSSTNNAFGSSSSFARSSLSEEAANNLTTSVIFATISQTDNLSISLPVRCDNETETEVRKATTHLMELLTKSFDKKSGNVEGALTIKSTTTEHSSSTDKSKTNSTDGDVNSLQSSGIDVNSSDESSLISNPPNDNNNSSRTPAEILLRPPSRLESRNSCQRRQLSDCRIIKSVSYTDNSLSNVGSTQSEERRDHPKRSHLRDVIRRLRKSVGTDSPTEVISNSKCSSASVSFRETVEIYVDKVAEVDCEEASDDRSRELTTPNDDDDDWLTEGMRRAEFVDNVSFGKIRSRRKSTRLVSKINYSELSDDEVANEMKGTVNNAPRLRQCLRRTNSIKDVTRISPVKLFSRGKSSEELTTNSDSKENRTETTSDAKSKQFSESGRDELTTRVSIRRRKSRGCSCNELERSTSPSREQPNKFCELERVISTEETCMKTIKRPRGRPKLLKTNKPNKPKPMPKLQKETSIDPDLDLEMPILVASQENSVILPAKRKRAITTLKRQSVLKDIKNTRNVAAPIKKQNLKPILSEDKAQSSACGNIGIYCDRVSCKLIKPLTIRLKKMPNVATKIPHNQSEVLNLSDSSMYLLRLSSSESIASTDDNSIDYLTRKRKADSQSFEQPATKLLQHSLDDNTMATASSNATANQTCLDESIDRNNFFDAIEKGAAQFNQLSRVNQSVGTTTVNLSKSGRKNSNELTLNTNSTMSRRLSKSACDLIIPLEEELEDNDNNVNLSKSLSNRFETDSQRKSLGRCSILQKSSIVAANMAVSLGQLPEDCETSAFDDTFASILLRPGKWRKSLHKWRRENSIILDKTISTSLRLQQQENQNSTIANGSFMLLPQSRSEEHIEGDREDSRVLLLEPTDDGTLNHQSISLLEQSRQQKSASVAVESIFDIVEKSSSTFRNFNDSESTHDIRQIYQHQLSVPPLYRQPSVPRRRRTSVIEHSVVGRSQHSGAGDQLLLFNEFIHEPYENRLRPVLSARDRVLRRCNQSEPLDFDIVYSESVLHQCRKIGEGVYGEVFMNKTRSGEAIVLKIIPIEGHIEINGEPQKKFDEILSEIVIGVELSRLRDDKQFMTGGFVEVKKVCCVQGRYPEHLVDQWELYRDNYCSENDHPEIFPDDQLYIVLELANGGQDLEAFTFQNALQSYSAFLQTALTLAVAEQKFQFEHRDLHWGNILLAPTDDKEIVFRLDGNEIKIPSHGVKATIIDYTLSRMVFNGCRLYNDLSNDSELFLATGDYQFDIYRLMKQNLNNQWDTFEPYTNTLWLHYTIDKMINGARYRYSKSKKHRAAIQELMRLRDEFLEYKSAYRYAECLKYDMASTLFLFNIYK